MTRSTSPEPLSQDELAKAIIGDAQVITEDDIEGVNPAFFDEGGEVDGPDGPDA